MVRVIEKILCRLLCKQSIFKSKDISSKLTQIIFRCLDCQNQAMVKGCKNIYLRIFISIRFENQKRKKLYKKGSYPKKLKKLLNKDLIFFNIYF